MDITNRFIWPYHRKKKKKRERGIPELFRRSAVEMTKERGEKEEEEDKFWCLQGFYRRHGSDHSSPCVLLWWHRKKIMRRECIPYTCRAYRVTKAERIKGNSKERRGAAAASGIIVMKQFPEPIGVKWTRCVCLPVYVYNYIIYIASILPRSSATNTHTHLYARSRIVKVCGTRGSAKEKSLDEAKLNRFTKWNYPRG